MYALRKRDALRMCEQTIVVRKKNAEECSETGKTVIRYSCRHNNRVVVAYWLGIEVTVWRRSTHSPHQVLTVGTAIPNIGATQTE